MASAGNGAAFSTLRQTQTVHRHQVAARAVSLFRGSAPALAELIAERLDVMIRVVPRRGSLVRIRRICARSLSYNAVRLPTLEEVGHPGYDVRGSHAFLAPKGVPRGAVETIYAAVNRNLRNTDFLARLAALGAAPEGGTPDRLAERLRQEIRATGVKVIHGEDTACDGDRVGAPRKRRACRSPTAAVQPA